MALIDEIKTTEIKNENTKIAKPTLSIYAFVYYAMMDFSVCEFIFEKVATQNLR